MRTFIAIDLDPSLKKTLEELVGRLRPRAGGVRWVKPAGMHLTLKFLGETREETAGRIKSSLEAITRRHRPFRMRLCGTGVFPEGRKAPRVLWVGVDKSEALECLQEEVEREMEKLGFAREGRAFHPHLTLGRVKDPFRLDSLLEEFRKDASAVFGEMEVRRLTFFQSVLKPDGAEYHVLAECPLG